MTKRTIAVSLTLAALVLLGATVAWAGERAAEAKRANSLKHLGLKVYWSILHEDQKDEAKALLADFLVDTAPDRLEAVAHLVRFKANVARELTPEQRRAAVRLGKAARRRTEEERRDVANRLLDGTDRALLARRVEDHQDAAPADKVEIGLEILEQAYAVIELDLTAELGLSDTQRRKIRAHYEALVADIRPVAIRLETAKAASIAEAVALLDDAQRAELEIIRADVTEKVLAFLRG